MTAHGMQVHERLTALKAACTALEASPGKSTETKLQKALTKLQKAENPLQPKTQPAAPAASPAAAAAVAGHDSVPAEAKTATLVRPLCCCLSEICRPLLIPNFVFLQVMCLGQLEIQIST